MFSYTGRGPAGASTSTASRCHDYGKEAGKKLNLAGDLGLVFNTSYVELRAQGLRPRGRRRAAPRSSRRRPGARTPAGWPKVLLEGHGNPEIDRKVQLDRESIDRIVTWIDINAPYYPEYATAYRDNLYGRSPIDMAQLDRLGS